ncbi:ATP-grasp domain-containing protein [Wenzhouxiangella sp. XN79A]|nr:ATP-grasp domain-containing protein [Wenzhouxiangella sp. XN79A]
MFKRILIANRGEIACRIIATCRRLGIDTVAVHSEADRGARHVRLADQAIEIGPAEAAKSYLVAERIIDAARATGAEAVHPGYGFLSENADFARALDSAGITLIGPRPETIEAMGSKARAKALMEKAGVPLVPGYHGEDQAEDALIGEAERVGFPLMLKAAAGGGGKGMRVVRSAGEFRDALAAACREARSAFGDDRMILERYVEHPRHIEAQVFGDRCGNIVHLFERDCSSQRRHQKVIEEAPAPDLDPALRVELLEAAVRAARAVDYVGAGTVEFLVDRHGFYFLEMNTRLQVEHPVTECVTGQDLVEWQLRVAAGQPLPLAQDEITCRGHAMEARIYAEDPDAGFLPESGRVEALDWPAGDWIRVDRGIDAGDAVSVHYDPMIAKLIVHGENRTVCRARLLEALSGTRVAGLTTNLGFLQQLAAAEVFRDAALDTGYLDRDLDALLDRAAMPPTEVVAAAVLALLPESDAAPSPWGLGDGWRLGEPAPIALDLEVAGTRIPLEARVLGAGAYSIEIDGRQHAFRGQIDPAGAASVAIGDRTWRLRVHRHGDAVEICEAERRWAVHRRARFEAAAGAAGGSGRLLAPMPGKVIDVRVSAGDRVESGQTVALMEAMKMELSIKAEAAGTVGEVAAAVGDLVEADALLLQIEPD